MGMYIPNMKSEQFYDLCKEHGLEIIAVPIPPHGDLIERDALKPYMLNEHYKYRLVYDTVEVANAPTIIPASFENPTKNARYSQDNPAEEG